MRQALTLTIADTISHRVHAQLTLSNDQAQTLTFCLPRWIPGSYLLRDFARHISNLTATDSTGQLIELTRTALGSWTCEAPAGSIIIDYDVYAYDASVRACYVVPSYAFINPAACALYVDAWRDSPYAITLQATPPSELWQVHTTLPSVAINEMGFGTYQANSYDHLIDHPLLMGNGVIIDWHSAGIAHRMVLVDEAPLNTIQCDKLIKDLQAICESQHTFWGNPPYERYLFQVMVSNDGYGGLEHSDSTALMTSRNSLPYVHATNASAYEDFLALCSHEYFHAWMVKRIKPAEFVRPDLQQAVITPLLWVFEGFTSLYDDWFLHRSGRIGTQQLLTRWSDTLNRTLPHAGAKVQSLADASQEAWIKFYQPNENSNNSQVSYYTRGAAVAIALLCECVKNRQHLDDLLQLWWCDWQENPTHGITQDQMMQQLTQIVPSVDWSAWFTSHILTPDSYLQQTLSDSLSQLGLQLSVHFTHDTGLTLAEEKTGLMVKRVAEHSPAHAAGILVGDELLAVNQWRTQHVGDLEKHLLTLNKPEQSKTSIDILLNRKGYLTTTALIPSHKATRFQLVLDTQTSHENALSWLKNTPDSYMDEDSHKMTETITRNARKRIQRTQGSLF